MFNFMTYNKGLLDEKNAINFYNRSNNACSNTNLFIIKAYHSLLMKIAT